MHTYSTFNAERRKDTNGRSVVVNEPPGRAGSRMQRDSLSEGMLDSIFATQHVYGMMLQAEMTIAQRNCCVLQI